MEFIEEIIGMSPISHRAGAYGYNFDTIKACKQLGLTIDSSNFFGHPNCKAIITKNEIVDFNGILELPVTYLLKNGRNLKTDLNWLSVDDFRSFYNYVCDEDKLNFINIFLHSYSLTETCDEYRTWQPSLSNAQKFEKILEFFKVNNGCEFSTLKDIYFRKLDCRTKPNKSFNCSGSEQFGQIRC